MAIKTKLLALARAVADEAERNAPFRKALQEILEQQRSSPDRKTAKMPPRNRRAAAKVDPVQIAKEGGSVLRALDGLNIEELKDIVAEFGMDPSKLVMKWKDKHRIASHIAETASSRASKGEVFRH